MELKSTPLTEVHQKLGAQMAPFGEHLMPIQYTGILAEHKACREGVTVFDICHMGEFYFKGDFVKCGLDNLLTLSISKLPIGKCKYGFMLRENGGTIDDLIVYKLSEDELMIVVNSATTDKDDAYIRKHINGECEFVNMSADTAKLDIQGPKSREVMAGLFGEEVNALKYFGFQYDGEIWGENPLISRTGYTGELGYEIYCSNDRVPEIWDLLLKKGVVPAGLGARDILRLEMGYSLYGHELNDDTSPLDAGLDIFVDFSKDFVGKDALLKQKKEGLKKQKIAFRTVSRRSPREHYKIFSGDTEIGEVSSGAFSPMLSCGIGMGYVKPEFAIMGNQIILRQDAVEIEAQIVELPFYKNGSFRK